MKRLQRISTLLLSAALLTPSTVFAQLLSQGNGNLPSCGQSCSVISNAVSSCNGGSNADTSTWACFCKAVWANSNGALTTMCASSCTNPSDNTAISTWYTANCGSDNGASEHAGSGSSSGGGGSSGTDGSSGSAQSSAAAGGSQSGTPQAGASASDANSSECVGSWWNCHWQWVIMVIVLAIGLTALGVGGRWLKKRHDRKKDRISSGFNEGITTRGNEGSNPQMSTRDDSAIAVGGEGRNSPSRSRENFMPYGYGYTRSESRVGDGGTSSPLARGGTPVNEMEKYGNAEEPSQKKSRRVLVREKSGDA